MADDLTADVSHLSVEDFQARDGLRLAQEFGDQTDALILALGAPETNRGAVFIVGHARGLHERTDALPADLVPQMKLQRFGQSRLF